MGASVPRGPQASREGVLRAVEAWFAAIAAGPTSDRFRVDYGLFLREPARLFALVDEALYIREVLESNGRPAARVLDVGCGFGVHTVLLALAGCREAVGVDPSPLKMVEARRLAALAPVGGAARFVRAMADPLPFRDGAFDAVLARESLSHVPDPALVLKEVRRVLAPGGVVHVRDYNNAWGLPARRARRRAWRVFEEGPAEGPADPPVPAARIRRRILRRLFPEAPAGRLARAAAAVRGHWGAALAREAANALGAGGVRERPEFPFRDPATGAAEERVFSPLSLRRLLAAAGFRARVLPPRHFHAQPAGLRRRLATWRETLLARTYPASILATPLIEATGTAGPEIPSSAFRLPPPGAARKAALPSVTVVIPSRDGSRGGNVARLREDLAGQTLRAPVEIVAGVSPCGRAHNVGARRARGDVIVFLDDDVRLGHARVVENLVRTLAAHPDVGIAGASQLAPPRANAFQRACVRDLPRAVFPVVGRMVDTDMATHAAMAIRRDLYERVGGEPEDLLRADDQVLRARVRAAGLRVVVAPDTWVYHPPPADWTSFWRSRVRDGVAAAHDRARRPDLLFDTPAGMVVRRTRRRPFAWRAGRAGLALARDVWTGRPLAVASRLLHAAGYAGGVCGWARVAVWEGASRRPGGVRRAARPRLLFVGYTRTRFQDLDRALLARRFRVASLDYAEAFGRCAAWRWWLRAARDLARARGGLCWFADRHALGISLLGRLWGRPVAVVVGGYEVARFPEIGYGRTLTRGGRWTVRGALSVSRRVVANSDFIRGVLVRERRVPPGRVVRIHHGVFFPHDPEPAVRFPREPLVLTAAEVTPANLRLKGLAAFAAAAARAPELRWIVAGTGEPKAVAALLAGAPPNLAYAGFLSPEALAALYARARFYVQASRVEGFGMALAEAMLYGCVPVTTGTGGMPEVTGGLGLTVPPEDPEALAAAVRNTPPRAAHEAAARRIRERFPAEARAEALAALFTPCRTG